MQFLDTDIEARCPRIRSSTLLIAGTVLRQLKRPDSSLGPDGLHPLLFVNCADVLAEPLSIIFQESYNSDSLPPDWNTANIVPISRKATKLIKIIIGHAVSLTSVPCKIMESIIKDNITAFLEENNVINAYQHGFINGRSCLTNLLESLEQ